MALGNKKRDGALKMLSIILFVYGIPIFISLFFTYDPARSALLQIPFVGPYIGAIKENSISNSLPGIIMTGLFIAFVLKNKSGDSSEIMVVTIFGTFVYFILFLIIPLSISILIPGIKGKEEEVENDCNTRLKEQELRLRSELSACPEGQRCTTGGG